MTLALAIQMVLACVLDRCLGDPRRVHPVALFGRYATMLERTCRGRLGHPPVLRVAGALAWLLAVAPAVALAAWLATPCPASGCTGASDLPLQASTWMPWLPSAVQHALRDTLAPSGLLATACLYFALGARSLAEHGRAVSSALGRGALADARAAVSMIVSRDTEALKATEVSTAAVESMLENGSDAVFAALFWFALAGAPGVVLYRCVNTLDAMWGYRNTRFHAFGWTAARVDDVLNYIPARLTALTYALLGRTGLALACWRKQARAWDSPNAGPVMAAGAGALGVRLGGEAVYFGHRERRPVLGAGPAPAAADIERAITLVGRGMLLWLTLCVFATSVRIFVPSPAPPAGKVDRVRDAAAHALRGGNPWAALTERGPTASFTLHARAPTIQIGGTRHHA